MIILSPSKTMQENKKYFSSNIKINYKTEYLIKKIIKYSKEEMRVIFKINGKTLEKTYAYYNEIKSSQAHPAILKYSGIVFKQLEDVEEHINNNSSKEYLSKEVYIISALYGLINSLEYIKSYRLDFNTSKIVPGSLYTYWKEEINAKILKIKPQAILNLASQEYSKILDESLSGSIKLYNIKCIEKINSTQLKKIRGEILNYCLVNKIKDYTKLNNRILKSITFQSIQDNTLIFSLNK